MNIKIFNRHDIEQRKERRRRIRNSKNLLIMNRFGGGYKKAIRLSSDEFSKEKYEGVIYFDYGGEYIVFPDWKYTPEEYRNFIDAIQDDQIFYSVLYKDLDGKIAQTHFKRL